MPEAKHSGSAHTNPSPTLLAFKPRQVLLAEHNTKAMAMKQHCSSKTLALNPEQKALLLYSVLGYLERNGFSRTLKRLLSEAQIENDNWKCSVNLEDMYDNYLETCTRADTKLDNHKEQELLIDGNTKKDRDSNCSASEQTIGRKKKKKSDVTDGKAAVIQSGTADKFAESAMNSQEILANTDTNVELKEKKKSKKVSDSSCQTEEVSAQALKVPTADTVCELQTDESTKKQKDKKKKKSQLISESLDGNAEQVQLDSVSAVSEEKCKKLKTSLGNRKIDSDVERNCKDKKKKNKKSTESLVENIEQCKSALENMHGITSKEKKVESKDKKRKKDGKKDDSVSETLPGGVAEVANKVYTIKRDLEKEPFETSQDAIGKEKKSSKKRKRLASDENEGRPVEELESEESKRRKTERLEQTKSYVQLTEVEVNEDVGKENKVGNGHVGQNEIQTTSIKQLEVHANGNLEKNGQKSAAHKTRRNQHNGSAEPKTVNAFQRVKLDEVEFVDERLQDNSYWAKDGAEVGYGAKAQEILGQVKGRDFRHEKTKKKRGSYRGGQIDLHSHSVKFNYSDED